MRHSCILVVGVICGFLSSAIGSYEGGYGSTHDHDDYEPSYAAPPIVHSPHPHGHSAGSYYHYHVPLVGQQQQHYQPHYQQHDHSHYLWPLLLLLALPLLFLPLLPLLLLPLGISLLALLAPGGMMMMMMMMMMGGEMMMRRGEPLSGRALNEMRTFGEVILMDMTGLFTKYARSLDLDQCPQRAACELGTIFSPETNATDPGTAKAFTNYIMDQYVPKGRVKKTIRQFEKAFWNGYAHGTCNVFQCQPTFKVYKSPGQSQSQAEMTDSINSSSMHLNATQMIGTKLKESVNYIYPNSKPLSHSLKYTEQKGGATEIPKIKIKRSHYTKIGSMSQSKLDNNGISYNNDKYFSVFGTPTVRS